MPAEHSAPSADDLPRMTIVVIGRNEGKRLATCLESVFAADYPRDRMEVIYVDTDSTDDSCVIAADLGARVVRTHPQRPTAAAARNAGLKAARSDLIHFLDGDTILDKYWLRKAVAAMRDEAITAVYGRRDELAPSATIYNFWTHHDWYVPPGKVDTCGGDVLWRRKAVLAAGGYDPMLIAGEERDLSYRMINYHGARILRLDEPMTLHDINMTRFSQYWRRCFRSGYAYAQVAARYPGLKRWRRTCGRNIMHALVLLAAVTLSLGLWSVWPVVIWALLVVLAVARDAVRCKEQVSSTAGAVLYAAHHYLSKAPIVAGHLAYYRRHFFGGDSKGLIEYRGDVPEGEPISEIASDVER
ncbi:MAG: glycosyltransferase [Phycisphaerae bacterium]